MPSSAALSMTHKEENAWRNFAPGRLVHDASLCAISSCAT